MLGPLFRPAVAGGVLLATGLAGVVLAGGASSATPPTRVTYGPVALPPPAKPLVDVRGPLLPAAPAWASPPLGPPTTAAEVGPPGVVGPGSPPHRVRAAQRLLNRAGAQLRVDGAWGPATTRAVEAVQARAGLPVTGRLGPATAALLQR